MAFAKDGLRAIVFDYGSTLIEFGAAQIDACDKALAETLRKLYGPANFEKLREVRNHDRRAPYINDWRENDMTAISTNLVRELYGREPSRKELEAILSVRSAAFVEAVEAPEYLEAFLSELSESYRLGLLSNYPDAPALRASLAKIGLEKQFDAVVVTGELGRVKPHELPFSKILEKLGVAPAEALYVGDNWLGDIQGAKRVGMRVVWTLQFESPEKFDRRPGDVEPDMVIHHLTELRAHL